jgi:hypothetical protein
VKHLYSYLKQTKFFFSKSENRKIKQILSGGWHQWEGGGYKKSVKEEILWKYYALMCENGKMRLFQEYKGRIEKNGGRVNSTMIL